VMCALIHQSSLSNMHGIRCNVVIFDPTLNLQPGRMSSFQTSMAALIQERAPSFFAMPMATPSIVHVRSQSMV